MSPSGDSLLLKLENLHRIVKKAKSQRHKHQPKKDGQKLYTQRSPSSKPNRQGEAENDESMVISPKIPAKKQNPKSERKMMDYSSRKLRSKFSANLVADMAQSARFATQIDSSRKPPTRQGSYENLGLKYSPKKSSRSARLILCYPGRPGKKIDGSITDAGKDLSRDQNRLSQLRNSRDEKLMFGISKNSRLEQSSNNLTYKSGLLDPRDQSSRLLASERSNSNIGKFYKLLNSKHLQKLLKRSTEIDQRSRVLDEGEYFKIDSRKNQQLPISSRMKHSQGHLGYQECNLAHFSQNYLKFQNHLPLEIYQNSTKKENYSERSKGKQHPVDSLQQKVSQLIRNQGKQATNNKYPKHSHFSDRSRWPIEAQRKQFSQTTASSQESHDSGLQAKIQSRDSQSSSSTSGPQDSGLQIRQSKLLNIPHGQKIQEQTLVHPQDINSQNQRAFTGSFCASHLSNNQNQREQKGDQKSRLVPKIGHQLLRTQGSQTIDAAPEEQTSNQDQIVRVTIEQTQELLQRFKETLPRILLAIFQLYLNPSQGLESLKSVYLRMQNLAQSQNLQGEIRDFEASPQLTLASLAAKCRQSASEIQLIFQNDVPNMLNNLEQVMHLKSDADRLRLGTLQQNQKPPTEEFGIDNPKAWNENKFSSKKVGSRFEGFSISPFKYEKSMEIGKVTDEQSMSPIELNYSIRQSSNIPSPDKFFQTFKCVSDREQSNQPFRSGQEYSNVTTPRATQNPAELRVGENHSPPKAKLTLQMQMQTKKHFWKRSVPSEKFKPTEITGKFREIGQDSPKKDRGLPDSPTLSSGVFLARLQSKPVKLGEFSAKSFALNPVSSYSPKKTINWDQSLTEEEQRLIEFRLKEAEKELENYNALWQVGSRLSNSSEP